MGVPPNIPPGTGHEVLDLFFDYIGPVTPDLFPVETPISLCDNVIGDPPKENLIVVEGRSIRANEGLALQNGSIIWNEPCMPQPEIPGDGIDNDCDGLIDEVDPIDVFDFEVLDPETLEPPCLEGPIGGEVSGMLHLTSPEIAWVVL